MTGWKEKLSGPRARTVAIALYVVCVAGLIMVYLAVSLRHVDYAAYMRAQPEAAPGAPVAMRGLVLDAYRGVALRHGEVDFRLVPATPEDASSEDAPVADQAGVDWASARIEPDGYFQLRSPLPEGIEAGEYRLVMRAQLDAQRAGSPAEASFVTDAPFRVLEPRQAVDYWPEATSRRVIEKHETPGGVQTSQGPIEIAVWPADGQVARGLQSRVYIRTTRRETGEPVKAKLWVEQTHGMSEAPAPATIQTDALGLASVPIHAVTDLVWALSTSAPEDPDEVNDPGDAEAEDTNPPEDISRAKLILRTVPSQVSLRMTDPLAVAGRPAQGALDSLFQDGGVMVDLYQGARWVDARIFGVSREGGGVQVDIPKTDPVRPLELYRVQVYRSVYGVENAWDLDYLVGAAGDTLADYQLAARALAEHLGAHTEDPYFAHILQRDAFALSASKRELRGWIWAMTEALPRHFDLAPALINSREASIEALDAEIEAVQQKLRVLIAIALLIGLAFVGYWVLLGVGSQREQKRMLQEIDLEIGDPALQAEPGDAVELARSVRRENMTLGVLVFVVVGTLALFALGLLMLLSYF